MAISVREKNIEEIKERLLGIQTSFNKIIYLESALREKGFTFEIKRFIYNELANLYSEKKMFEKAAKAMSNKAGIEITSKEKINSYINAADFFSKAGNVDDADEMFVWASRSANAEQKSGINLAKKNIYLICAHELEKKGKKATAVKFYEKLIKTDLDEVEKKEIKDKLISTYNALGHFREARLLEGI
jgi:tetratricopeptide (TPR) repeat protein